MASLCAPAHQVQQDQRVQRAQPQRGGRIGAAVPGEAGQGRRHQGDTEQGHHTHAEESGRYLPAGQRRQSAGDGEEDRAVRGRRRLPHGRHLLGERAAEPRGAVGVDVDVGVDHGALREIAVDVPAEEGRREQQRCRPGGQDEQQGTWGRRFRTAHDGAQQRPGGYQQDDTEVHPDQAQYGPPGPGGEEVARGQGPRGLAAQRQDGGTGQAQSLAAAEIDGESHGQHSASVSTPGGRKATWRSPGGVRSVTSAWWDA